MRPRSELLNENSRRGTARAASARVRQYRASLQTPWGELIPDYLRERQTSYELKLVELNINPKDVIKRLKNRAENKDDEASKLYLWIKEWCSRKYVPENVLKALEIEVTAVLYDRDTDKPFFAGGYMKKQILRGYAY